jgi:hypothetical protein
VIQIPNNLFFQKMFRVAGARDRYLFEEFEPGVSKPGASTDRSEPELASASMTAAGSADRRDQPAR